MGNQPICSERIALKCMTFNSHSKGSYYTVLMCVKAVFKPHSEYKEIIFSCKIMLQATLKASGPLKSLLDIIRSFLIQHVTCDCLFQRRDDARGSWRLAQDVIFS